MGRISLPKKSSGNKAPDPVGNFFKGVGNSIVSSSKKTNEAIKTTFTSPEAMKGYKIATNVAIGIVSLTPVGKLAVKGAIAISDKVTGGKATGYLGAQNSTIGMLPGGVLAQAIMGSVDPNAQAKLNQYDPKKSVMNNVKTVAKTAVTHPTSTLSVAHAVTSKSVSGAKQSLFSPAPVHSSMSVPTPKKQTIFGTLSVMPNIKPSAHSVSTLHSPHTPDVVHKPIAPVVLHKPIESSHDEPIVKAPVSTIQLPVTVGPVSVPAVSSPATSSPIAPVSTIQLPATIAPISVPVVSSSSDVSSSMMLPAIGGALLVLFFIMK